MAVLYVRGARIEVNESADEVADQMSKEDVVVLHLRYGLDGGLIAISSDSVDAYSDDVGA